MDSQERQQYRQEVDRKTEYANLNAILAEKHKLDMQLADLTQQMAALQRKIAELDKAYHKEIVSVRPTVVVDKTTQSRGKSKSLLNAVLKAAQANPGMLEKIQDNLDGM